MIVKILILSLFSRFISCSYTSDFSKYSKSINELIPNELSKHLPREIGVDDFEIFFEIEPYYDMFMGYPVTVYISYELNNVDSFMISVRDSSIQQYKFDDECNVILYKYQTGTSKTSIIGKEWLYEKWVKELDKCSQRRIPIPNFIDVGENMFANKIGISDDYMLFVTQADSGKYFSDRYYNKKLILPKGWERGYSQGYAINEKEKKIIYWLAIW